MSAVYVDLAGVFLCLIGSAFFSGSETALTSLSQAQIERLIESEGATSVRLWRDRPIEVLTAVLIGNNLVNITASALATRAAGNLFEQGAVPIAVGVMTFLLLTFGEITPKTFSKQWAVRLAGPIMSVMTVAYYAFYPFTMMFTRMTRSFMSLVGDEPDDELSYATEELEYLVDVGSREGSISEERERMLRSVFEFPETIVREVMVPRTDMVAISVDMNLDTIVDILVDCGHSRIPVYEENLDEIRGLFYAKDLIRLAKSERPGSFDIDDFIREPYFVPESKRIAPLLSEFQAERMHMAIVVDEFGGTEGLITLEDIIEEFFGDIKDEYDTETPPIRWTGEGTARVDARVHIDDVEEEFDIELPERPDYESLGGFLLDQVGDVPDVDNEIEWDHLTFRVLEADPKRVQTVEVDVGDAADEQTGEDADEDPEEPDTDTRPELSEASW